MERRLGIAVVGCGGVARQFHLRALRAMGGARVVAVADPDPEARRRAARMVRAQAYEVAEHAIEHPAVGAVVVCAPNAVHADLAIAALDARRHVYVEKPVAATLADARRVAAAADRSGGVAAVGLSHRFDPLYRRARALLRDGAIGDLVEVSTSFREPLAAAGPPVWKRARASGGGALIDLGTHQLDGLRWLASDPLVEVESAELRSTRFEHDDARVTGRLRSGAAFEASFGYGEPARCGWVFAGSSGWLAVDRRAGRLLLARDGATARSRPADALRRALRVVPVIGRDRTFARALGGWVDRVRRGSGEIATVAEAITVLEDVERIEAAAAAVAVH